MEPERQSSVEPTSTITSSADRMVGVDHAEIRYFTRYEEYPALTPVDMAANIVLAMITMVNTPRR